jgi:protein SCO1/2
VAERSGKTAGPQRLLVLVLAAAGFGAGIAAAIWSAGFLPFGTERQAAVELPRVPGGFSLVAADGSTVGWDKLGGRLQLVFFGFTNCPEACPATLSKATQAIEMLGERGAALRVLLISVDPERDTPEAMAAYASSFGERVVGLTGSAEQVAAAAAAFGVFYAKVPMEGMDGEYMMNHTASMFLLGPGDEILEIVSYGAGADEIVAAIDRHI